MFKHIKFIAILLILTLAMSLSACLEDIVDSNTSLTNIKIEEYLPKNNLLKAFNGGFENSGTIHIINKIDSDKYQTNIINYGNTVVRVYKVTNQYIKLVYNESGSGVFDKNYSDETANKNIIVLKTPIAIGTSWKSKDGTKYEITGVNKKVTTPSGDYITLEITTIRDNYQIKNYYVKEIGLVKRVRNYEYGDLTLVESLVKVEKLHSKIELNNEQINKLIDKYLGDI
ncbi:hypothetical protein [Thermohalobacter berrensis]|uniref:Lipoprotein n=1 Tax=Thermohalobacter berrensis TaxID=99594 RepID=A0A419TB29_9FIRM|nr:hypothetical protein [Thermohalobacter berrensis]RKD34689.1 hypothetical protein BET03_02360 [Thermohalobacter berrensis]